MSEAIRCGCSEVPEAPSVAGGAALPRGAWLYLLLAIILRKVLKPRLIGVFLGVVTVGILAVGYLFNLVL